MAINKSDEPNSVNLPQADLLVCFVHMLMVGNHKPRILLQDVRNNV